MDLPEKKLLEETAALAKENNRLLKKMRRAAIWGRVMHLLYWVLIIGVSLGLFYFLQPYIDQVKALYEGLQGVTEGIGGFIPGFGN